MAEQRRRVKTFLYTEGFLKELETSLSPERMDTYRRVTRGDIERAALLYTWNTAVSGAFYGPLQGLEVALRNAMHRQIGRSYGATWYNNPNAGLDDGCRARIAKAKLKLRRDGYTVSPPQMVAMLPLGFWVSLLGPGGQIQGSGYRANYEMTLWRPALRKVFPYCKTLTRRQAHKPLNYLRILRNRIAHHEPIFARNLRKDHQSILKVTGWISPGTREWIEHHSRVPALLRAPKDKMGIHF